MLPFLPFDKPTPDIIAAVTYEEYLVQMQALLGREKGKAFMEALERGKPEYIDGKSVADESILRIAKGEKTEDILKYFEQQWAVQRSLESG